MGLPYNYFVELESPMLHVKFQNQSISGSGIGDILRFSLYMGVAVIWLCDWTGSWVCFKLT